MSYRFELLTVYGSAKETELEVTAASIVEALAGEHTLSLTVDPYRHESEQYVGTAEDSTFDIPIIRCEKYIRVTNAVTGDFELFIVTAATKQRDGEKITIAVECEHHKYRLLRQRVHIQSAYSQISATEYLNLIMPYATGFTLADNDIPTTLLRDVEIDHPSVMEALRYLCEKWTQWDGSIERRFYPLVNSAGQISIVREDAIGAVAPYPLIYAHNLPGIRKKTDSSSLVNRLYNTGLDNRIAYADTLPIKDDTTSNQTVIYAGAFVGGNFTLTMDDAGGNSNNVAWDSVVLIKLNSVGSVSWPSGAGSFIVTVRIDLLTSADVVVGSSQVDLGEVTYPTRSTGNPKWYGIRVGDNSAVKKIKITAVSVQWFNGANPPGVVLQKEGLQYELAPNVDYVEDIVSQDPVNGYGLIEDRLENRDHPKVVNIISSFKSQGGATVVFDATLSDTYTAGKSATLRTISSGITLTENTNRLYINNGSKSQHVVTTGTKPGVGLAVAGPRLAEGWSYQLWLLVYVVSGQLDINVNVGSSWVPSTSVFAHRTSGVGWLEIASQTGFGLPSGMGAGVFDITINAAYNASDFYLDSFCLARSAEPISFYKTNSANTLKDDATRILRLNKSPRTQYEVDLNDLSQYDSYYGSAVYNVGDDVRIQDPKANIIGTAKIFRSQTDLFNPRDRKLTLADRSVGMAEMISLISGNRNLRGL